jgi:chromosome partitioning protein
MPDITKNADAIIVPVLPSDIDIHACSKCIADLLLIAKIRRDENRIGVVANRVKRNTLIYQSLMRFLETLRIPSSRPCATRRTTCARPNLGRAFTR